MDHTTQEGLDHIVSHIIVTIEHKFNVENVFQCEINKMNLQSEDFVNATIAGATKGDPPIFAKL